jgi:hypothetical protein
VTVTDNNGGTANPGDLITYTITITTDTAATGTTTGATFEMQADPNLWPVSFSDNGAGNGPWDAGDCSVVGGALENDIKCTDAVKPVDDDVITVVYEVIPFKDSSITGPNEQPAPECEVYDTGDGAGNGKDCAYTASSLATTINDYNITPNPDSNGPKQDHLVTIVLPSGFVCTSDATPGVDPRTCSAADVILPAGVTLVNGPNVSGTTFGVGSVNFTINSAIAGTYSIKLNLSFATGRNPNSPPSVYDLLVDPIAIKTYAVVAQGGTAELRHVDLPDLGTEDASGGSQDPYCADYLASTNPQHDPFKGVCGVLPGQEDNDDAIGSFHGACIIGSLLTQAVNGVDITWHIDAVPPGVGPVAASVSTFAGPNGEPCVMWGAATTGTQQITAIYHEGLADQFKFWWDTNPNLPLIKEWNTIDSTRIVSTTGDLGFDPAGVIAGNTGGAADWVNRDCSTVPLVPATPAPGGGDCILANLDSLTMPVEASFILNPNSGSFIKAAGHTFIDYTMGHHADAGGAYTGPVDGASQTYCNGTLSALSSTGTYTCSATGSDCGSIRLEDPTDGDVNSLQPGDMLPRLSSDKGVAFEFVPNDDGALLTTINNADCGPGATICVTIGTIEANQFRSPPLSTEIREKICVQYNVGPPTNKTPILAWAGQRVVLENYWGDPTTESDGCPGFSGTATGGTTTLLQDTNAHFTLGNPCGDVDGQTITFTSGTGAGESATIISTPSDTSVTFAAVAVAPDTTTHYSIAAVPGHHPCASNERPNPGPVDSRAIVNHGQQARFGVQYSIQAGSGSFTGAPLGNTHDIDQTGHDAIVHVATTPFNNAAGITDPNSNCTSRIIVESEDQTEMDVVAYIVGDNANVGSATPRSQQVAFVIYFMKFESEKLQLIPDNIPTTDVWDKGGTPTTDAVTATVSDNVAAQVTVKGWVLTDNCPGNPERTVPADGGNTGDGQARENFPANRCIFPDDWAFKAGALSQTALCTGATAPAPQQCRPEMDIASPTAYSCPGTGTAFVAGPFSLLDQITHAGLPVSCGDSLAPYPPADAGVSRNCLTGGLTYSCRDSNFPDGQVTPLDAAMPPSLVQFNLAGAGFLKGIGKAAAGVDTGFNSAAIPAEPWISQINADGEGYVWNTWGAPANNGLYDYWTDLAAHGPQVISCAAKSSGMFVNPINPSANPCVNDPTPLAPCAGTPGIGVGCVRTGGYDMTEVYSDEHGVAMALINGDANLAFTDCSTSAPVAGTHTVVLLKGFYCPQNATVGTSTLTSVVDYPDKRKHFAEVTNPVTITWKWNGIKDVSVVADPVDTTGQFWYVVFHVTDRDGFCSGGDVNDLHPVLGERVDFRIDSTTGTIAPDVNGNSAEGPAASVAADLKSATTHTFDSAAAGNATIKMPTLVTGECQAWIHVSESLHNHVNVVVTAFDPEGTVTFDNQDINPTPVPTAVPTAPPTLAPTATPFVLHLKWGDSDCDGNVAPRDGQAILLHFLDKAELSQTQPCPSMSETVMIAGHVQHWGDFDCNGAVAPRDGHADLYNFLSKPALSQTQPCPLIGSAVDVLPIVP